MLCARARVESADLKDLGGPGRHASADDVCASVAVEASPRVCARRDIPLIPIQPHLLQVNRAGDDARVIRQIKDVGDEGVLVCEGCVGKAYGLDLPVGQYFKLYVGDSQCQNWEWHVSAYITNRLDY